MSHRKLCWLDLRLAGDALDGLRTEAIHHGLDAVVAADPADLESLPPTVTRVLFPDGGALPDDVGRADIVIVDSSPPLGRPDRDGVQYGRFVEVVDAESLERACESARTEQWTVLLFRDPTKIPLEIVLAAAASAKGSVITVAADPAEAEIIFGVLEHGSDGVMMAPRAIGDATRLRAAAQPRRVDLDLVELTVTGVAHVGLGERACVDTCSLLRPDEGILVGSYSKGLILCVSETHPLPYMQTRPFRVNAGAVMSYTLSDAGRTRYLSELHAGSPVLAVDAAGHTRVVTVGRTKIETRPLLSIDAIAPDGRTANLIVQHDWHVRILGPGGAVLNSTSLRPGDRVLGYLPTADRHVGYPIDELCVER